MHDPFQSHAFSGPTLSGAYSGAINPFGLPQATQVNPMQANPWTQQGFQGQQSYGGVNPLQQINPLAQINPFQQGNPFQQINPLQQLQGGQIGVPQAGLISNPLIAAAIQQNPLLLAALQHQQNQLLASALQNPLLNPIAAQVYGQQGFGQYGNPYAQQQYGNPWGAQQGVGQTGFSLAPQTWIGQTGQIGNPYAQFNPMLAQLAARQFQTPGAMAWGV